jgi:hypothetical protein
MFMENLEETGWKLKKLKHIGVFAGIFDRRGTRTQAKIIHHVASLPTSSLRTASLSKLSTSLEQTVNNM